MEAANPTIVLRLVADGDTRRARRPLRRWLDVPRSRSEGIFGIGSALIRWNAALVLWLRLSGDFMLALSLLSDVEIPMFIGAGASCPGTALLT
jgi:hypothetical protein